MLMTTLTPATLRRAIYASTQPASRPAFSLLEQSSSRRANATVEQDDHSFTLSFDVPGVAREHLSVGLEDNLVRLTTVEGAPRHYQFTCELPQEIDPSQSVAKLELGVLTLKLAKVVPASRVTELVIQ